MTKTTKITKAAAVTAETGGEVAGSQCVDGAPEAHSARPAPGGKLQTIIALLRRPEGALISDLMAATGWQAHSIRGAMAGAIRKKHGLTIISEKTDGVRTYRVAEASQ
jgi:hypothetical protein